MNEEIKKDKKGYSDLFRWRIDEDSLEYEIQIYNKKGFKPIRKQIATLLAVFFVLSIALSFFGYIANPIGALILLVAIIFIYKGSKSVTVFMIAYYTINQIAKIILDSDNFIIGLTWWLIIVSMLWKNYQVENEIGRRKKIETVEEMKKIDRENSEERLYCVKCGNEVNSENKFCVNCGTKT